jgi:hypothetical protein
LAVKKGFSGPFGARALLLALARQHLTQIFWNLCQINDPSAWAPV